MRNLVICFLEVDELRVDIFSIHLRFLDNLLKSENLVCCATAINKPALGIIQLWFNCFVAPFLRHLGTSPFSGRLRRDMPW